jgi:hypothetical protein
MFGMDRTHIRKEQEEARDQDVADLLPYVMHEIAESLGIGDKPWTQEEQDRISDEADRLYRRPIGL